uniref:Reverse transcriptase domain-containing protein n=1 Tax=Bracon brevicornis TaxID=1563983 RepID=A0A6V7LCK3_9HYME
MGGLDYALLKELPEKHKLLLLDIFNEMFVSVTYPSDWSKQYLHFTPKSSGKAVRPIALTSCLCKLLETMIKSRLQWWVEHNYLLPDSQSGFRKGRSGQDNLASLLLTIETSFQKDEEPLEAFLDIKSAFDNVNSEILLDELSSIGCPLSLIKFVKFLTYEKRVTSPYNSNVRFIHKGVPQGGVLSALRGRYRSVLQLSLPTDD